MQENIFIILREKESFRTEYCLLYKLKLLFKVLFSSIRNDIPDHRDKIFILLD